VLRVEPPVITSTPPEPALAGQPYQYQVQAQDAAGDPITYGLDHGPPGMTIDPTTGLLSWPSPARIYAGAVLSDKPAAYWQLDETSGTVAHDASANHLDGTYNSSVTLGAPGAIPQDPDTAAQFETGYAAITVPDSPALDPARLTIEAWVNSDQGNDGAVVMKTSSNQLNDGYGIYYNAYNAAIYFFLNAFGGQKSVTVAAPVPMGKWTYVVATYDGTAARLYVNGKPAASTPYSGPIVQSSQPLLIGSGPGTSPWRGSLDEVAIYDTALTADQVAAHYRETAQQVIITATDGLGGTTTQAFNLGVVAAPIGPPVITSTPLTTIRLGNTYRYPVQASSPNGSPLTFQLPTAPAGMTIDATGLITWDATQPGPAAVTVRVQDTSGGFATQTFTIGVSAQLVVRPPSIVSTPGLSAVIDQPYTYDAQATDPQGAAIAWSLASAPAGLSVDPLTGTLRWTPAVDEIGTQPVVLRALDSLGASATQSFTVSVNDVGLPPVITSAPPEPATVGKVYLYAVAASDPAGGPLTFSLPKGPAGMAIDPDNGVIIWMPNGGEVGQQSAEVTVTTAEGQSASQDFTVAVMAAAQPPPEPPVITSTAPLTVTVGALYQYQVMATDPQNETLTYALQSGPSGMTIDSKSGLLQWTPAQAGQGPVTVAVTNTDGAAATQTYTLTVEGANQSPTISSQAGTSVTAGATYHYDVQASDPDGDTLTYQLDSGPQGASIDAHGRLAWPTTTADAGSQSFKITVSDGRGGSVDQSFAVAVTADTESPQVSVAISANPAGIGSTVTFVVSASDNVGVAGMTLTVGRTPLALDPNGRATLPVKTAGQLAVIATATDAAGNTGKATESLLVIDPTVTGAPTVALSALANNGVITAPVSITGTASDPNLLSYSLEVGSVDGGDFHPIATGTASVTNGVLGQLDPTMLANDSYVLRLTATNAGGKTASVDENFSVMGGLKLGNFTLAFTDLTVPVSGIPITVTRTYDTLNANSSRDFGYGWSLDYRDTHLRTSIPKTGDEANGIFNAFRDGTRVYVTLPGGQREGFTFEPINEFVGDAIFQANFVPDPGVTDQLTVPGETSNQGELGLFQNIAGQNGAITLSHGPDGGYVGSDTGTPYNPADDIFGGKYFVTTKDGTEYQIDGLTGLLDSVTDPNGNTLTFTDAGIISSAGPAVTFARDPQGRITAVTDPLGQSISYHYDGDGNLVAVTDRMKNITQFVYRSDRPHYLDHVIDPMGHTGVRSDYDDQGRLKQLTNGDNQPVKIAYDPGHDTETVLDALNNPTVYEYDDRGNILKVTDALNGVTQYTYDANNNVKTMTDPLQNMVAYSYDNSGNLLTETDALGHARRYAYNASSQPLSITNALGNTTTISYDGAGNPLSITGPLGQSQTFTYDNAGNQSSLTNPNGGTYHFTYDAAGRLMHQVDPLGDITDFTYNAAGNKLTETTWRTIDGELRPLTTTYTYDANNRLVSTTDPLSGVSRIEYNSLGQVSARIDQLNRRTTYDYDPEGRLIKTTFPDGTTESSVYDAAGNKVQDIDQEGRVTTYVYDSLNRLTTTIFPDDTPSDPTDNPREQTIYDAAGNVTARIDAAGNRTDFSYDAAGRLVLTMQPQVLDGRTGTMVRPQTRVEYDAAGRRTATFDADGGRTQFIYDSAGRLTTTIFPDGTSVKQQYDSLGDVTASTDQAGRTTSYTFDLLGRSLSVTLPRPEDGVAPPVTTSTYDEAGNLISRTDALHHTTLFKYDELDRLVQETLPMGQSETFAYDPVGNQVGRVDYNQAATTFTYDSMDRLTQELYPDGSKVSFTYTPSGQRQTVTDGSGTTKWTYDARDRITSRTDPDGRAISYTYDVAGNESTVTVPSGTTTYGYDALNRMESVTDPAKGVTHYTYDPAGNLVRTERPDGTIELRQYDDMSRLVSLQDTGPAGSVISGYQYTMDPTGLRIGVKEDSGRTESYTYDGLDRLTKESISDPATGSRTIEYTYDAVGNRLTQKDSVAGDTTYTYDQNDRLLTETQGGNVTKYTYDNNGNLQSSVDGAGDQANYSWDFENRLVGADVKDNGQTTHLTYRYDADGNRVAQTTDGTETRYLVDTNRPLAQTLEEYGGSGVVQASYVYGLSLIMQDRGGVRSFFHFDGLGSVRALTSSSGVVTDRYVYDAFGRLLAQSGTTVNSYLFAGEQFDSGLSQYYLRARYYNPDTGRFDSSDPMSAVGADPRELDRYAYARNDPADRTDPTGAFSLGEIDIALAIRASLAAINAVSFLYNSGQALQALSKAFGDFSAGNNPDGYGDLLKAFVYGGLAVFDAAGLGSFFKSITLPPGLIHGLAAGRIAQGRIVTLFIIDNPPARRWFVTEFLPVVAESGIFLSTPREAKRKMKRGQAPWNGRIDAPRTDVPGSQWHAHQTPREGSPAVNLDGTPRHAPNINWVQGEIRDFLRKYGWNVAIAIGLIDATEESE
jgi:RHS repeat-associated protein